MDVAGALGDSISDMAAIGEDAAAMSSHVSLADFLAGTGLAGAGSGPALGGAGAGGAGAGRHAFHFEPLDSLGGLDGSLAGSSALPSAPIPGLRDGNFLSVHGSAIAGVEREPAAAAAAVHPGRVGHGVSAGAAGHHDAEADPDLQLALALSMADFTGSGASAEGASGPAAASAADGGAGGGAAHSR